MEFIAYTMGQLGISDRRGVPRGGRGRSRSPPMIDRYQPGSRGRDEYYENGRDHPRGRDDRRRQASPPMIDRYVPGETPQPIIRTNPLPDPLINLDFQVGFNWFAEWWRMEQLIKEDRERAKDGGRRPPDRAIKGERESKEEREKERAQIQAAYDSYKEDLQIKMARMFVQLHKDEEWFKERYLPEYWEDFKRRVTDFRRQALIQWDKDMDTGYFDEFSLEGIYKTESDGMGGVIEKEEGETVGATEVLGVGDLVPSRGGDIRDETTLQPALLIKTLAPMVSRAKIEELCREHLGEGDGGFKWLSLSDPNPQKKCHRIGWIMLNPSSDESDATERGDGREDGEEDMDVEAKPSAGIADKALEVMNGKTIEDEARGNFTCHVGVHAPPREPRKKALWDLFSAPERVDRDLELAKRLVSKFDLDFGSDADGVAKVEERVEKIHAQGALRSAVGSSSGVKKDKAEDEDMGEEGEEGEESEEEDDDTDNEELLIKKKTLDLLIEYLRRVFNFCFFCVFESDSVHELVRKCPGGHLRRPRASLSTSAKKAAKASAYGEPFPLKRREAGEDSEEAGSPVAEKFKDRSNFKAEQQLQRAFNWVKTFEEKILQILEPENVDVKKLGGKPIDEALDEELSKFVKKEDENKFRCKVPECTKLFKGDNFWRKHVEKRHAEWFEEIRKSQRSLPPLKPSTHIRNPRGFNLQSIPGMMPGFPGGFQPNGQPFTPFAQFGNHTVQAPQWNGMGPGMMPNGDDLSHQAGPMRRGGGRFSNGGMRSSGPYDRRQQPRFNPGGPMMMPNGNPMGMGMGMGRRPPYVNPGGKWGDGAGAQTVGPREAVMGRSLKKYDDLDAVEGGAGPGGSGGGELNY
ncbi:uncharacterized protein KY384_004110 [Bacidia gigantensis]|uniref:uncharacterized protein n=1 Tax=Bacidia gigantensis TaxID=2732470 RepID=UPI001D0383B0|nr:uncharacterized protein KY384_004110 [Bacidia gigantensis]KAG8530753.1 hypothetical protein KY384_004110 [Bacidia gigantensis]